MIASLNDLARALDWTMVAVAAWTVGLIVFKGFELYGSRFASLSEAVLQKGMRRTVLLRAARGLTSLSAIAAAMPFVGLAATVLHVVDALRMLESAGGQIAVISGPVALALVSTLLGLASAIPAQFAWHYFDARVAMLEERMND